MARPVHERERAPAAPARPGRAPTQRRGMLVHAPRREGVAARRAAHFASGAFTRLGNSDIGRHTTVDRTCHMTVHTKYYVAKLDCAASLRVFERLCKALFWVRFVGQGLHSLKRRFGVRRVDPLCSGGVFLTFAVVSESHKYQPTGPIQSSDQNGCDFPLPFLYRPLFTGYVSPGDQIMQTSCRVSSSAKQKSPHAAQGTALREQPPSISCLANSLMITASPQRVQLLRRLGHTSSRCRSRSTGSRRHEQSSQGRSLHVERMCRTI